MINFRGRNERKLRYQCVGDVNALAKMVSLSLVAWYAVGIVTQERITEKRCADQVHVRRALVHACVLHMSVTPNTGRPQPASRCVPPLLKPAIASGSTSEGTTMTRGPWYGST